jgi:hypothetical protein
MLSLLFFSVFILENLNDLLVIIYFSTRTVEDALLR